MEHRPLSERIRWGNLARLTFVVVAAGAVLWTTADGGRPARLPADVGVVRPRPEVPPPRSLPVRPPSATQPTPRRRKPPRRRLRRHAAIKRPSRPPAAPPRAAPTPVYASGPRGAPSAEFGP